MKAFTRTLVALPALLLAHPNVTRAQATESVAARATKGGKLRMALIPVDASKNSSFTKPMISAAFEDAMLKAGRFITLSRDELAAIQSEQKFAASGAVDPASAVKLGKALSANYAVVVRQLAFDSQEGKDAMASILGVGRKVTTFNVSLQAQAIDVETSEIVLSKSFSKKFETSAVILDSRNPPKGTESYVEPYKAALQEFAEAFTTEFGASIPLEAVVVLVRDVNNIAINAGGDAGLRVGARFELIEEGQPIKDPSGAILGYDTRTIGTAELVRVEPKLSWLRLVQTMSSAGTPDAAPDVAKVKQYLVAKMVGGNK